MKVSKSFINRLVEEELRKVLSETAQDDVQNAEAAFERLLDEANLEFYFKDGKFYLTLPTLDPKIQNKDQESRQQNTIVLDVVGFATNEPEIDI